MNASENYSIHEIVESGHEAIKYLAGNHNPVENAYFTAVFENAIAHLEYIERLDWPGPDGLGSILTVILQLCDDEELAYPFSQIMQIRNLNASVENPLTQSQLNTVGQLPWYRMILDFGCATAKTEGSWKTYEIFSKAVTGLELLMAHEIPSPSILGATIWCTLTTEETVAKAVFDLLAAAHEHQQLHQSEMLESSLENKAYDILTEVRKILEAEAD